MEPQGSHTRAEILSQPEVWAAALRRLDAQQAALDALAHCGYDSVVFTGCGSPYYLGVAAAAAMQEAAGITARAVPAGELWLDPEATLPAGGRTLLVAASRSGITTETLRACAAFLSAGRGDLLTISCDPGQTLASMGALNLTFPESREQSLAQTRAFSALYLAALYLAARWGGRDDILAGLAALPAAATRLIAAHQGLARELGADAEIERFYFLGSGARYGLACELSLKLKEMALTHCEPFHFLEFRHGPRAMATKGAMVVGLLSRRNRAHEAAVLAELRAQGARTLAIGDDEADVAFGAGLPDVAAGPLYVLQFVYDLPAVVENLRQALVPGGVLLVTLPAVSQICRFDMDRWGDYWRFTSASARRLLGDAFGAEAVRVVTYGNVLAACAFLYGLAVEDLSVDELLCHDPDYELLVAARAVRGAPGEAMPALIERAALVSGEEAGGFVSS